MLLVVDLEHPPADDAPVTHVPWAYVDDLDAHFAASEGGQRDDRLREPLGRRRVRTCVAGRCRKRRSQRCCGDENGQKRIGEAFLELV